MRHLVKKKKLKRDTAHRRALLRNLVTSFLEKERIRTTLAKAKAARPLAEKMITLARSSLIGVVIIFILNKRNHQNKNSR